ncbi:MAG: tryptophan synthase subunit alpha [Congregibacter sp.]
MSRIESCFAALREAGRTAVVPYIVAGDPGADITVDLMCELADAGADIIELGVPFSDPMSEGPVIQRGHERALEEGVRLRTVLDMVREFRTRNSYTPVLLMGYVNPVAYIGYAHFADIAAAAGVDALLTVDVPPEEVGELNKELRRVGLDNIFLIAPTTPIERMDLIVAEASGFIYYVSLKGVTGAGHLNMAEVTAQVAEIQHHTALPICVGFGIKDGPSAAKIARCADGVVIGSALVQRLADVAAKAAVESTEDQVKDGCARTAILAAARAMVEDIREHVDAPRSDAA